MQNEKQPDCSFIYYFFIFLRGLCMGIADLIPGISGGTVAFITGIYDELLASLKSLNFQAFLLLFTFRFREFFLIVHWKFLLALMLGIGFSMVLLAHFFLFLLNDQFYSTLLYAFFLGLILASILLCINDVKIWSVAQFIGCALGGLIALSLTWTGFFKNPAQQTYLVPLPSSISIDEKINFSNYNSKLHALTGISKATISAMAAKKIIQTEDQILCPIEGTLYKVSEVIGSKNSAFSLNRWQIFCGMVAICAMLLPGVSGSYLLAVLGMYHIAIGAIVDITTHLKMGELDIFALSVLINLFIGILFGLIIFSRSVSWLLKKYRSLTLAILIGFMIGALGSVWPFWQKELQINPLKPSQAPILHFQTPFFPNLWDINTGAALLCLLCGFCLVFSLSLFASKIKKNHSSIP